MQKWEYMVIANLWSEETNSFYWYEDENDKRGVLERLNALGKEGWELVSTDKGFVGTHASRQSYLKRPIV